MAPPPPLPSVRLKAGRDKAARHGHPWLFSGAVASAEGPAGPVARVLAANGEEIALGFYQPGSRIPVRLLTPEVRAVDGAFFASRLAQAMALRAAVLPAGTTGYRVLNAEGDGVPGWTVDRFGDVLVSQITAGGLEALRALAYRALEEAFPGAAIVQRNRVAARKHEGLPQEDEVITGSPPETAAFEESGLCLAAEILGGQKTGFYCDQRENRRLAERLARGRTVLDLFAHTGAFSLYALRGGAERALAIESAERLAEIGRLQARENGVAEERLRFQPADVFAALREPGERSSLVICDPPPLVPRKNDLERGARAYKDLNRLALKRVLPGGFFLTFTCSGAVDAKLFRQILFAAADEARVPVALLKPLGAAPDHPIDIRHPEGEYLKGWLCVVGGAV